MPMIKTTPQASAEELQKQKMEYSQSQWDTLVLTFWVSRWAGVAPVCFHQNRPGCPVAVSRPIIFYGYFLVAILHAGLITGLVIDLSVDRKYALRTRTNSTRVAWLVEQVLVISIISIGSVGAPQRIEKTIRFLNIVDKVNSQINCHVRGQNEWWKFIATTLFIASTFILYALDFFTFYLDTISEKRSSVVLCLYTCFYMEKIIMNLLELQFMWVALFVQSGLHSTNKALENLIYIKDLKRMTKAASEESYNDNMDYISINSPPSHTLGDEMHADTNLAALQTLKLAPHGVRRLVISYGTIYDVIIGINGCYGLLLLLFIGTFILHFVVTPFYFIAYLNGHKSRPLSLVVQILFVIHHFLYMISVVEPGHLTDNEMEQTRVLVRQLLQRVTSPRDPLAADLEVLFKLVTLNQPCYRPLNLCRVTRPLITMVLGGATTYLVIILQFQQLDLGEW